MRGITAILACALLAAALSGCASGKGREPSFVNPHVLPLGESVAINTFTLDQSDFPIFSGFSAMPRAPEYALPEKAEACAIIAGLFAEEGFVLQPDQSFNYGKIHIRLDGYSREHAVGFKFVSEADFESPRPGSRPLPGGGSLFNTEPDPDRISASEMMLVEQLNHAEHLRVALINAHQFAWRVEEGDAGRVAALENLKARVRLYLRWLKLRREQREGRPASP